MAGKVNTSEALAETARKLTTRLNNLEGIRTDAKKHLDTLAQHYSAESANEYHEIMFAWDVQFDKITQALAKVINAMGGSAKAMDHTEQDNKEWATKFHANAESLTLPI